jgi:hypothetical protein
VPTALALWLLATGRWGSYVGDADAGLFVTEIALAACIGVLLVQAVRGRVDLRRLKVLTPALALCAALLTLAVVRLITSDAPTRDTFRDFAPYGYAFVALLTFLTPMARWEASTRLIFSVLTAHTAWLAVSILAPDSILGLPVLGGAPLFAVRPDFDGAVSGLAVGLGVYWLRARRPGRRGTAAILVFCAANAGLLFLLPSRAGLLAAAAATALALWCTRSSRPVTSMRAWTVRVVVVAVGVPILALGVAQTAPGQRLEDSLRGEGQAAGTTNARRVVWGATTEYILDDPVRAAVGVGFGPDFLHDSGAAKYYEGVTYTGVRSPHNYQLGTWARLGLPGLLIVLALTLAAVLSAVHVLQQRAQAAAVDALAALTLVAIPVVGALGVVQESPFGAVPYFWAIGHAARVVRRLDGSRSRDLHATPSAADADRTPASGRRGPAARPARRRAP